MSDERSRMTDLDLLGAGARELIRKHYGRALAIRMVDAGSCNGCEVEMNALSNPYYDVERFGIQFVASPRHADLLLVTGPVSRNMEFPLRQTYEAMAEPRMVAAMGVCAISGGMFAATYAGGKGVAAVIPVDIFIPGCPPRPVDIVRGIMQLLKK